VKERASTMGGAVGSRANSVVEGVTQAVATAAGVVVGTVQALRPDNADAQSGAGESGAPDVMAEGDDYEAAEDVEEDGGDEDEGSERTPEVSGM
jgi:hypothetical protein